MTTKLESTCLPALEEISMDEIDRFQHAGALHLSIGDELVNVQNHLPAHCTIHLKRREKSPRYSIW